MSSIRHGEIAARWYQTALKICQQRVSKFACRNDKSMAFMLLTAALICKTDADNGKNCKLFYAQATAFPGKWHFDDPWLLDKLF
jgi:hypothetical protein